MGLRTGDLKMKATKKWKFSRCCTKVAAALLRQKAAKLKLFCLLYVHSALLSQLGLGNLKEILWHDDKPGHMIINRDTLL